MYPRLRFYPQYNTIHLFFNQGVFKMKPKAFVEFSNQGWKDFLFWQARGRKKSYPKITHLIHEFIKNDRNIGHPEPEPGVWSMEINKKDRIIYKIKDRTIRIEQCRNHNNDH